MPMLSYLRNIAGQAPEPVMLRAETAVEELLTNSVVHGGGLREPGSVVWIGVTAQDRWLNLRYEDAFAPFDPADKIGEALRRTTNPLDQRPLGGLGLLMVYRLADAFRYCREGEHNCIDLTFQIRADPAQ